MTEIVNSQEKSNTSQKIIDHSKKKQNKSKREGNKFENKISKELGEWIFSDKFVFERDKTSGGSKNVYVGDIIPIKQINWRYFPFIIECKHGYKDRMANLNQQRAVKDWILKAQYEKTEQQQYLWLIIQFQNYSTLFITDHILKGIHWDVALNTIDKNYYENKKRYICYVYQFKDIKYQKLKDLYKSNNDVLYAIDQLDFEDVQSTDHN